MSIFHRYRHENRAVIRMMCDLYEISYISIVGFQINRSQRFMRHDDGRQWTIPDDWDLS